MENIVLGLLAHVDRGKTSLSESLLFESGKISKKGRVDHGDSLLDHDELERKKGITIYAKSVYFSRGNKRFFLLDTPGHREFSGEMERALQVLDYGILLLDAKEGVGKREKELWKLTKEAGLPLFIFVNKMDLYQGSKEEVKEELKRNFPEENILDFSDFRKDLWQVDFMESIALSAMESTEEYLEPEAFDRTGDHRKEKTDSSIFWFGFKAGGDRAVFRGAFYFFRDAKSEKRKGRSGNKGKGRLYL